METDHVDPKRQLEEYDDAVRASQAHGWEPAPRWLFPLFALSGPAIVAWSASNTRPIADQATLLRVVSIVFWVVALGALLFAGYRERANATVRPRPPIEGGRTTVWMFLAIFALLLGLFLTGNLASGADPWPLAIASYLWLVIVPWVCWARHVKVLTQA